MIAEYQVHTTTVSQCLFLEPHNEIHDVTGPRSAIEKITSKYEMGLAAAPGQLVINDAGTLQGCDEAVVRAVDVSDGYDSLDVRIMPLVRIRRCQRHKRQDQKYEYRQTSPIAGLVCR